MPVDAHITLVDLLSKIYDDQKGSISFLIFGSCSAFVLFLFKLCGADPIEIIKHFITESLALVSKSATSLLKFDAYASWGVLLITLLLIFKGEVIEDFFRIVHDEKKNIYDVIFLVYISLLFPIFCYASLRLCKLEKK